MINIQKLETRWFHYKIKSYIPLFILTIITIISSAVLYNIYYIDKTIITNKNTLEKNLEFLEPIKDENNETKNITKVIKPIVVKKINIEENLNLTNKKITIVPSLGFINKLENSSPKYYVELKKQTPKKIIKKVAKPIEDKEKIIEVKEQKVEVVKKNLIHIKKQNTQEDIKYVISRFKKSNNPALSLFIAKKYYELGDYNKAYNYALITNEINNDIEDSWIVFSKSLVKLNRKEKAIKILTKYINHSHSNKAKILLDNIKLGKIK